MPISRGTFLAIGGVAAESWNMSPSDAKTLVSSPCSQFEVARPDTFFELFLKAHSKP